MKRLTTVIIFLFLASITSIVNAEQDPQAEDRDLMRGILADVEKGLNKGDFKLVVQHLHPEAVITYYNAEVTRNHAEAEDYYQRMIVGAGAVVEEYSVVANVSAPAEIHGDMALATGTTTEKYKLAAGLEFELVGNWTATMLKTDGQWKIIAIHFSTNLFDNPLLNNANRFAWIVGIAAFLAGLIVMFVISWVIRK